MKGPPHFRSTVSESQRCNFLKGEVSETWRLTAARSTTASCENESLSETSCAEGLIVIQTEIVGESVEEVRRDTDCYRNVSEMQRSKAYLRLYESRWQVVMYALDY